MSEAESNAQNIIKSLHCPFCHHQMVPPILLCENNHSICTTCTGISNVCPTCAKQITTNRNTQMEQLIQHPYPCKNQDAGCKKTFLLKDLEAHEVSCPLRMYYCEPCRPRCRWRGRHFQILEHMKDEHKELVWVKAFNSLVYENFDVKSDYSCIHVLSAFRELFWCHSRRDTMTGKLYEVIQLVGKPRSKAACYTYEMQFYKREGNHFRSAFFRNHVHGEEEDIDCLFKSGDCIVLDLSALRYFIDDKKRIFFDLKVEKTYHTIHQENGIYEISMRKSI